MRIKPLVVLSLVCSLSQAADTVASLGDSIKATQFVTAVDHTRLVNDTTEVLAKADGTASIVSTTEVYGFKVSARTRDQSRSEGYQPILIEMEIPVPLTMFDDAMFRTVQSIRLRICEPLTGGNPREIVPWQTVALDHTKFGGPESQYFGIADNAITQVNSEWFTDINPGYNWINDVYNSPFRINYANATVSSLYTAWGPLGSTTEDIVTTDLVGKERQIATIDQIQPIAASMARQIVRDAVSSIDTDVHTAEDARVALTNLITILKNL